MSKWKFCDACLCHLNSLHAQPAPNVMNDSQTVGAAVSRAAALHDDASLAKMLAYNVCLHTPIIIWQTKLTDLAASLVENWNVVSAVFVAHCKNATYSVACRPSLHESTSCWSYSGVTN